MFIRLAIENFVVHPRAACANGTLNLVGKAFDKASLLNFAAKTGQVLTYIMND